jgi:hypothetical protein
MWLNDKGRNLQRGEKLANLIDSLPLNSTIVYKEWLSCGILLTDSGIGFFERLISKIPFSISTESDSLFIRLNKHV